MMLLPAHISRIATRADGSWHLVAELGELTPEQVGELSKTANKVVALAITLGEGFTEQEERAIGEIEGYGKEEQKEGVGGWR